MTTQLEVEQVPSNKEMAGKVLREKKEKREKTTGMVTIIPGESGAPAYRLGVTSVKTSGGKISIKKREEK